MGKRLNRSETTFIETMLNPLSDSFSIQESDTLEQWYYVNTGDYSPDRQTTPLVLTPTIKAVDERTGLTYAPSFSSIRWYYFDESNSEITGAEPYWPGLHWVPVTAIEPTTGGTLNDYYVNENGQCVVQKNVPPTNGSSGQNGQPLCCVATYADPRDSGVTIRCSANVLLATSQDATEDILTISLLAPTKKLFNIISKDFSEHGTNTQRQASVYRFEAKIYNNMHEDVTSQYYIEWYARINNAPSVVLINTLPCYTKANQQPPYGQGKKIITLDAIYAEHLDIICRLRKTSSSPLLPFQATCSLVWEYPDISANTVSKTGRAVDGKQRPMIFSTNVNMRGNHATTLTDAQKHEHFLLHYVGRKPTSGGFTDIDLGWGLEVDTDSANLKQTTTYSTPVHTDIYTLGAYENVVDNGSIVTDDDGEVYDRYY